MAPSRNATPAGKTTTEVEPCLLERRYRLDASTKLVGDGATVIGGSPMRLFRLTPTGRQVFDEIAAGRPVRTNRLTEKLLDAGAIHPVATGGGAVRPAFCAADVTVVVPTHDTPPARLYDLLRHCVDTAAVVFVDDGSGTPLTGVRGATLVRLRHNSGPGAARNAGARAAETPLVAFVDTDVDLHPGWLDGLLGHFGDQRVGFVAPRVASGSAVSGGDDAVARYEQRHSPLDLGTEPARIAPGSRVSYVPAATLIVRKAALDEVGGFDPALRCGEDVDLVWRLVESGWRGRYEPAVVVHHWPRPSWRALWDQRFGYGESAADLAALHGGAVAPVRISPWSLGVWALAASGHPLSAAGLASATAAALVPKLRGVPAAESLRLAGRGHLVAGQSLATALRRTWLPVVGVLALGSRRARRAGVAALVPALLDGGPARLFDDISYGAGVWKGVLSRRRLTPLLPAVSAWPRRDEVSEHALRRRAATLIPGPLRSRFPRPANGRDEAAS